MDKLKQHLAGKKKSDFAAEIGTSPSYLSQIISGHRRPSYGLMCKIEAASGGEVDLHSWSSDEADTENAGAA